MSRLWLVSQDRQTVTYLEAVDIGGKKVLVFTESYPSAARWSLQRSPISGQVIGVTYDGLAVGPYSTGFYPVIPSTEPISSLVATRRDSGVVLGATLSGDSPTRLLRYDRAASLSWPDAGTRMMLVPYRVGSVGSPPSVFEGVVAGQALFYDSRTIFGVPDGGVFSSILEQRGSGLYDLNTGVFVRRVTDPLPPVNPPVTPPVNPPPIVPPSTPITPSLGWLWWLFGGILLLIVIAIVFVVLSRNATRDNEEMTRQLLLAYLQTQSKAS